MWESDFKELKLVLSTNIKQLRSEKNIAQEKLGLEAGVELW